MALLSRTLTRAARVRKHRARLDLEALESRLAPSAVIGVNAAANVHAIDPNIYGAAFATTAQLADLNLTVNRDGGNSSDTYNWQVDATNHASDWYYEGIPSGSGNGQSADSFVSQTEAGGAQADVTIPILPYVASLPANHSDLGSYPVSVYGAQQSTDPYYPNFGNGVTSSGQNITDSNPLYNYVANSPTFEQTWIQHLLSTFGTPGSGGVPYFTLGNEPGLWNYTHRDIHPSGETNTELLNDFISYGSMIKAIDPGAQILGPEEWGWTNYFVDGADAAAGNYGATYNGLNAEQWLLQQLDQYQAQHGTRLLDTFTLHYYPQESVNGDTNGGVDGNNVDQATELLRNQVTRSLWDPTYVDPSWIASTGINGGKVDLIPMMQSWVNTYYPGTKTGITEYNFGAEGNMNGATTQADLYGIFGQQGLNLATRWTTPATGTPAYLAMKLWRNYDGNDSGFGDTSVGASVGNPDQTDAFAALRSSDGALTVAVINKNLYDPTHPSATTAVTINLSGFAGNGVAQAWQLAAINASNQTSAAITHLAGIPINGNSFTVNVPMESVTMFVIEPAAETPPAFTSGAPPSSITAGQPYRFTFTVSGSPTPALSASNLPSWLTFTPATGVLSGSPTLATTYTNLAVIATNAAGSATIPFNLTVAPGAVDHLSVSASPSSLMAGTGLGLIVTALDPFGNPTTDSGTVTFTSNDPQVPTPVATTTTFSGSTAFTVGTLKTATASGWTVTASDATGHSGPSNLVLVTPAAATHFGVSAAAVTASAHLVAGTLGASESGATVTINTTTAHGFTVGQSVNIAGVPVAGYNGTVMITSVPSPTRFTFTARANQLLLGASGGGTVTSVAITGSAFGVVVTALDPYGNTATAYTGTVNLTSSDAAATFPVNHYTFTTSGGTPDNGVHTFSATLNSPNNSQTITATDTSNASLVGSTNGGVFTVGLYLTAFATTPTGFTATFNKLLNSNQLDYYRFAGQAVPPDIRMTVGSTTTTVNGSVVVTSTATQTTLTFVATQGALTAGPYTVTLGSGSNGILDTAGGQFAGDANGLVPGMSYTASINPASSSAPTLVIPSFARGPGSNVLLPNNTGTGIPVTLKNAPASTTSVTFTLDYNPALLTITGPTSGNLVLNTATSTPGVANFSFSTTTNLSTSSALLGNITANVPSSASSQYQAKTLLDLPANLITIGGSGSPTFQSADGVEINAYLADVNADHKIDGSDAGLVSAVLNAPNNAANQPAGLAAYRLADPALLGSPSSNPATATPKITGTDVTLINRFAANLAPAQIPAPPTGLTYTSVGPDPALSLPPGLQVSAGGTVTVPVNIDDAHPAGSTGLTEATLALTYDPQVLTVSAADVHLGTLPASGRGWTLTSVINAVTGQLAITLESATPITQALGGSLVTIDFHVQPGATPGATSVAVVETVDPTGHGLLQTSLFDNQGAFTLNPAPTNGPADPLSTQVVLTAAAPVPTTAVLSVSETAPVAAVSTVAVLPAGRVEVLAEAMPSVTAAGAAPLPGSDDEETPGVEASPVRVVRPAAHAVGGEAVVANSGVLSAAQQAAALVFQFGNTPALSVPLATAPPLADAWFLALGRSKADLADRALLESTLEETAAWMLPGVRGSVPSASDDLDGQFWDGASSDLDGLPSASAGPSSSRTSETPAAAVMPERADLDQVFADLADDTWFPS